MATTGYVLLEGRERPGLRQADWLRKSKTPDKAEESLLELIKGLAPRLVAIDAPLTMPPCITCPAFCRGPGPKLCELEAAKLIWAAGGNPVTERLCEVRLRPELDAGPLPTMRIAQIAARGYALSRRLNALRAESAPWGSAEVLEVYPYASLARLGRQDSALRPKDRGEGREAFTDRLLGGLGDVIDGLDEHRGEFANGHVLDALIAAYTGWLSPDGLEQPEGFNVASGWIWLPREHVGPHVAQPAA